MPGNGSVRSLLTAHRAEPASRQAGARLSLPAMEICHAHNLNRDAGQERRFGVRVRLTGADPLHRLLGGDFERVHWFATATERDRALRDMASEHRYSRRGDRPTLQFEPIERA